MANHTAEAIQHLRAALGEGNADLAWTYIQPILRFPDSQGCSPDELAATWAFFEKAAPKLDFDGLGALISDARTSPDDPARLLALGQGLLAHDLHAIAATPLTHAQQLLTDSSSLNVELEAALSTALQSARTPLRSDR